MPALFPISATAPKSAVLSLKPKAKPVMVAARRRALMLVTPPRALGWLGLGANAIKLKKNALGSAKTAKPAVASPVTVAAHKPRSYVSMENGSAFGVSAPNSLPNVAVKLSRYIVMESLHMIPALCAILAVHGTVGPSRLAEFFRIFPNTNV